MIHDSIFSLLIAYPGKLPIEELLAAEKFIHPGERKILKDIIEITQQYQNIRKFTRLYGACTKTNIYFENIEDHLQKGLYLQDFAGGIDKILKSYVEEIVELERRYLQHPTNSLLFIFHKVNSFQPLFEFLQKLIDGIKVQKLHGCAIVQYLHQNMLHGNKQISEAIKIIFMSVNVVFLKQLTHWILYGKVIDTYGEFFIQSCEFRNNSLGSEKGNSISSGKNTVTTVSTDATSTYAEVWRYEICHEFLPYYLPYSWAEKVLFIGQTVLMFKMGVNKSNKKLTDWSQSERNYLYGSLYDNKEQTFFEMMQNLQGTENVVVSQYGKVIDEIKSYVTERLSQTAVKQADLVKQLKLIKDFYLLGRGELFLEFIKRTHSMQKTKVNESTLRDLIKAFDSAAHSINITDDLESFCLALSKTNVHAFEFENFACFQNLCLQYKIEWPLHLLFSPKVIERYNELFRFLLLVKKMQYELHMTWAVNRKEKDEGRIKLMHLLHQLMFLIDNLQYYIQVDVLESQFSILMNTVLNSSDFEHIQRAHSVFHANILSLCFLLSNDEQTNMQLSIIQCSENPVLSILNNIFHLCEEFCSLVKSCIAPLTKDQIKKIDVLEKQLSKYITDLMNLLVGLKAAPNSTPLSQLLLRLDFNYWFSRDDN